MNPNLEAYAAFCEWAPTSWLVVSENVFDPLIYYSHLVPILLSLPLALIIYWNDPNRRLNQYFFLTILLFSIWTFGDLILWANDEPALIMFVWSVLILLEPVIYFSAYLFADAAIGGNKKSTITFLFLIVLMLPVVLFTPTSLMLENFNLTNCWREVTEGPLVYYGYMVQTVIALAILAKLCAYCVFDKAHLKEKVRATLIVLAILAFLAIFTLGNVIGSYFENWVIGQYGIFGMPVMVILIGLLMPKYLLFRTNLIASQLLVSALAIITFSIIFVQNLSTARWVAMVTFVLVLILGGLLVRSIKREIEQKTLAQRLATELAGANARLERLDKMKSEFVSIASHQLRSPLTSIRGYVSMILEGSYGDVSDKTKEILTHVSDSARHMALSIDDFLNVSRIEAGNMNYDIVDADLRGIVEDIVSDMQPVSVERGIPIEFKTAFEGAAVVKLDIGKTRQIVQNLVDNAYKYTKGTGAIEVTMRKDQATKKVHIDVKDQGIGLSPESIANLFEKFERAKNASTANVSGSGLGLYIARTMARAMGGDITVASPGEGQGSTFTLTMPLNGIEATWAKNA